jgi:hypothetical protein
MIATAPTEHLCLPAECFYWALLDASILGQRGVKRRQKQLGYLFEAVLPVPIDDVHAIYRSVPGSDQRYLACGMARDAILDRLAESGDKAVALTPCGLPRAIRDDDAASGINPVELNLLTGALEPPRVRTLRRRWLGAVTLLIVLVGAIVLVGFERRIARAQSQARTLHEACLGVYTQVLGSDAVSESGRLPPAARLTIELRELRRTHRQPPVDTQLVDASGMLANLLALWPDETYAQVESLSCAPEEITVRAMLPTSDDAQALRTALASLPGWRLRMPQIISTRDAVRATLQFEPAAAEEGEE